MRRIVSTVLVCVALLFTCTVSAQQKEDIPPPPGMPTDAERAKAASEAKGTTEKEELPPPEEVTERSKGDEIITEYSRKGQVYMIKIKPKNGPSQYLLDRDGDGQFETKTEDLQQDFNLPKWKIGTW